MQLQETKIAEKGFNLWHGIGWAWGILKDLAF